MSPAITPLVVFFAVGVPALWPFVRAIGVPLREPARVIELTVTSLILAGLAAGIAVIPGAIWGLALARAGRWQWVVAVAGAAIPLSVQAVAWQAASDDFWEWSRRSPGSPAQWRPWRSGLLPAAFVHGCAGIPAVAVLVGLVTRLVDARLVELALLEAGWPRAVRRVLMPRLFLGMVVGGAWVALQAATEIPVTDAMQVRTAAEEVYTQFATHSGGEFAAAALTGPFALLTWVMLAILTWRVGPSLARPGGASETTLPMPTWLTRLLSLGGILVAAGSVGLPLLMLILRVMGRGGFREFLEVMAAAARTEGAALLGSLGAALAAGMLAATLATVSAAWVRLRPRTLPVWVAFALAVAVTPAPLVGIGLAQTIDVILDAEELLTGPGLLGEWLYTGPSPLPAIWVGVARFFPSAFAVCLARAWLIPTPLLEQAQLDGATRRMLARRIFLPALTGPWVIAAIGVAALSLGEVSASRLVDPPGRASFAIRLFSQMHYGAESAVAAMALLQVVAVGLVALVLLPTSRQQSIEH